MTRCEITDCKEPAMLRFTFNHPDPSIRWTACLCKAHTNEAAGKAAHGMGGYSLSPIEPPAFTPGRAE